MKDARIRKLVFSAMLAALVCVATLVIAIPTPGGGYVNPGDCFVLLCGWLLGPWYGAAAAGIGSMLTDIFAGYAAWAPGTLLIKALMGFLAAVLYRLLKRRFSGLLIGALASELWMVLGYYLYAALLLDNAAGALLSIPGNLIQGSFGILLGLLLMRLAQHIHLQKKLGLEE